MGFLDKLNILCMTTSMTKLRANVLYTVHYKFGNSHNRLYTFMASHRPKLNVSKNNESHKSSVRHLNEKIRYF